VHWMVNRLRDKISRKKSQILSTTDSKKKLEIDFRNLEFSVQSTDKKS